MTCLSSLRSMDTLGAPARNAPIVLPSWSDEVHYEAELAVVIKTLAKDVPVDHADDVILGYTARH